MKLSASHPDHFIPGNSNEYKDRSVAESVTNDTPITMHDSTVTQHTSYDTIQRWDPFQIKEEYMSEHKILFQLRHVQFLTILTNKPYY